MGVVVVNVLRALLTYHPENEYVLYLPIRSRFPEEREFLELGLIVRRVRPHFYPVWEQITLPTRSRADGIDVLWAPYNTAPIICRCPIMVTIHDTIFMEGSWLEPPTLFKRFGKLYRRVVVPLAVRRAAWITTVSSYSAASLAELFPRSRDRTSVTYLGAADSSQPLSTAQWHDFAKAAGISRPYLLAFGSDEPRKNTRQILLAYEALTDDLGEAPDLVIFGYAAYQDSPIADWIHARPQLTIRVLGYVSDAEKASLYQHALGFVFPSLAEGFGIPVVEAFHNGSPVVTSNRTATLEIAEGVAILVDPTDVRSIMLGMKSLVTDRRHAMDLALLGRDRARHFNWRTTASAVYSALERATMSDRQRIKTRITASEGE